MLAWRMMIESRLKPTTRQLQEWIKEQTAELPSAERKPFPKNQKQKGCRYNDVLIRHLVVTMHDLGFEKDVLLHDKEYVAEQPYAMLWREAVFRGIRPVANRELLHSRMFPKSENGRSLPKMTSVADVPAPGRCNGHDQVLPEAARQKRERAEAEAQVSEDEEEIYEPEFEVFGEQAEKKRRQGHEVMQRSKVCAALVARLNFPPERAAKVVAASSNEALGVMLGVVVVGPELIGEARRTKLVTEQRARVLLQEHMGVSAQAMDSIWLGMSVPEVEARIGLRLRIELGGDAVPLLEHLVATVASMYGLAMKDADRMVGVMDAGERDRLLAGVQESHATLKVWSVRRAVMDRLGRTLLAARDWVVHMSEEEKDEELVEEYRREERRKQEQHGGVQAPPGEGRAAHSGSGGAGAGRGAGAPAQVTGDDPVPVTAREGSAAYLAQQNVAKMIEAMGNMTDHLAQTSVRMEMAQAAQIAAAEARETAALEKRAEPEEEGWMKFVSTNAGPWNVGITKGVELEPAFDVYRQMLKDRCTNKTAGLVGLQAKNPYSAQYKEAIEGVCHQQWVKYICTERKKLEPDEAKQAQWAAKFDVATGTLREYLQKESNCFVMHRMYEEGNPGAAAEMASRLCWGANMSEYDKRSLMLEKVLKKEQKEEMLPQLMQQLYGGSAGQTQHRGSEIALPHGGNAAVEAALKQMQQTMQQLQKGGQGGAGGTGAGGGAGGGKGGGKGAKGLIDGGQVAPQLAGIQIFRPTSAITAKAGRDLNSPVEVGFPHACLLCEKQGHAVIDCPPEISKVRGERRASPRYLLSIGKCKADGSAC